MITPGTFRIKLAYSFIGFMYVSSFLLSVIGYIIKDRVLYGFTKALVMPSIAAIAVISWAGQKTRNYYFLLCAFFFACLGDIALALPRIHPIIFFLGGWLFIFQHVFYIWLNLSEKGTQTTLLKTPYWGLPTIAYIFLLSLAYWIRGNFVDKFHCTGYAFTLGTTFYTSFYREVKNRKGYWFGILGFGLFVISDAILIVDEYLYPMTTFQSSTILMTYYMAQTFICYSHILESRTKV